MVQCTEPRGARMRSDSDLWAAGEEPYLGKKGESGLDLMSRRGILNADRSLEAHEARDHVPDLEREKGLMSEEISAARLMAYQRETFFISPERRVTTIEGAIEFVNACEIAFFWPIDGVTLPSLWNAVAGNRPVPTQHDDPGHVTWDWKDSMLGERVWYYAKVLRKRATLISPDMVPNFYALSENYGSPAEDYRMQYEQGRMPLEAKNVFEALLFEGPLDTISLRRAANLTSRKSDYRFNKALLELQADFKVLPVGVAEAGAWNYAHIYDIVSRHWPEIPEKARWIGEIDARKRILEGYMRAVGAARMRDVLKLFSWPRPEAVQALDALCEKGELLQNLTVEGMKGRWYAYPALFNA
jgi:hypothetical protein